MTNNVSPGLDQRYFAASVCGKYCSRTAALTGDIPEGEQISCDTCFHWNNKPCILYNSICAGKPDEVRL